MKNDGLILLISKKNINANITIYVIKNITPLRMQKTTQIHLCTDGAHFAYAEAIDTFLYV